MFDDEDGSRSEAPVAAPSQYGVLGPLSRPKRQFFYDVNYVDYTEGSGEGSGFMPMIEAKIHILRAWDNRFSNKRSRAFERFQEEIVQAMRPVLRRVHRDSFMEVESIRRTLSGQCMAAMVVWMPDHEDRRGELERNLRNALESGRLGQLSVNTDYFEVTRFDGEERQYSTSRPLVELAFPRGTVGLSSCACPCLPTPVRQFRALHTSLKPHSRILYLV
ncbi:hypothetical protein E2C01_038190 [Portunus trituberculatus]|uniref:Uncharacterized protein n=1 Tax=Portunus trituberculatus TaxID=210409 RepID=A0A5B7FG69_PORTR|nr:hypothetical protein [Portunus trituberculatus]